MTVIRKLIDFWKRPTENPPFLNQEGTHNTFYDYFPTWDINDYRSKLLFSNIYTRGNF